MTSKPRRQRLRSSVVCQERGNLLVVRLRDPVSHVEALYPPGGGIEPNEAPEETARREALEETGLRVAVQADMKTVESYPFTWGANDYDVTTHYFAARLEDPASFDHVIPPVTDADYNLGPSWVPANDALDAMTSIHPSIGFPVAKILRMINHRTWRAHTHFAGPASTLLMIHDQFRVAAERLRFMIEDATSPNADLGWLARVFLPLGQTLHHHHHAEEEMLFPLIGERMGTPPERLEQDHVALTAAIDAVSKSLVPGGDREAATSAVSTFHRVLVMHLDREEALVVPVLLEVPPHEAWALIHS